jgi:hypothetical protein
MNLIEVLPLECAPIHLVLHEIRMFLYPGHGCKKSVQEEVFSGVSSPGPEYCTSTAGGAASE